MTQSNDTPRSATDPLVALHVHRWFEYGVRPIKCRDCGEPTADTITQARAALDSVEEGSREDTETCPTCWQPVLVPQRGDHDYGIPLAAASPSREGAELDVQRLAKAADNIWDQVGESGHDGWVTDPETFTQKLATEYARLASEEQREDSHVGK